MKQRKNLKVPFAKKCNKRFDLVKALFTRDSSLVISVSGCDVYMFHRSTGEVDKIFRRHEEDVLAIAINKTNPLQVLSCCRKKLILWDYTDMTVVKSFNLKLKDVVAIYLNSGSEDITNIYTKVKVEKTHQLLKYNLKENSSQVICNVSGRANSVSFSEDGRHVVSVYKKTVTIYDKLLGESWYRQTTGDTLVCVCIHPEGHYVAAGDRDGRILVWEGALQQDTEESDPFILHWHQSAPNDITFSADGFYLLSGGKENTLVVWHLETHNKSFKPRIGGNIKQLFYSKDSRFIGMTADNNMIHVLSALDHETTRILKFLAPAYDVSWGMTYNSKFDSLVLNGLPKGLVQFYQPKNDQVLLTLDVLSENVLSLTKPEYGTVIDKVVFDQAGDWMTTVHVRKTRILPKETSLHFWKYLEDEKTFMLNTLVNPPHTQPLVSMAFRPRQFGDGGFLITASTDGELKSWFCKRSGKKKFCWVLQNIQQNNKKGECKKINFSQDGSLLAVLYDEVVIIDPKSLTSVVTLSYKAKSSDPLRELCMCNHSSSNFVVGASSRRVIVWDVKTFEMKWQLEASISLLTADPFSKYFSVIVSTEDGNQSFLMLDPVSPQPVIAVPNIAEDLSIKGMAFAGPSSSQLFDEWPKTGEPYFLNEDSDIFCLGDLETTREDTFFEKIPVQASTFETMFSSRRHDDERTHEDHSDIPLGKPSRIAIQQMMTTPSHVLPDIDIMCNAFYHSLFLTIGTTKTSNESNDKNGIKDKNDMEIDNEDESENEEESTSHNNVHEDCHQFISSIKLKKPRVDNLRDVLAKN